MYSSFAYTFPSSNSEYSVFANQPFTDAQLQQIQYVQHLQQLHHHHHLSHDALRSFAHPPVTVTAPSANIATMITSWHNPPPPVKVLPLPSCSTTRVHEEKTPEQYLEQRRRRSACARRARDVQRLAAKMTDDRVKNLESENTQLRQEVDTLRAQLQQVQQLLLQPAAISEPIVLAYAPASE